MPQPACRKIINTAIPPAGDIEQINDQAFNESYYYSYDQLHRLISETTSTGSIGVIPVICYCPKSYPTLCRISGYTI